MAVAATPPQYAWENAALSVCAFALLALAAGSRSFLAVSIDQERLHTGRPFEVAIDVAVEIKHMNVMPFLL